MSGSLVFEGRECRWAEFGPSGAGRSGEPEAVAFPNFNRRVSVISDPKSKFTPGSSLPVPESVQRSRLGLVGLTSGLCPVGR